MKTIEEQDRSIAEPENTETEASLPPQDVQPEPTAQVITPEPPPAAPQPKKNYGFIVAVTLLVLAMGLAYLKRQVIPELLPYVSVIGTTLIAAGQVIFKDWNNYRPKWTTYFLLACIAAAATLGVYWQYDQLADRRAQERAAQAEKAASDARVKAAEKAQADNTERYVSSFETLNTQINDLKTKVATKELQDQLAKTQGELEKTRNALATPPPVKLVASLKEFGIFTKNPTLESVSSLTLPVDEEGVVKVPLFIYNPESRAAEKGEITVEICTGCKFAKEPAGFKKIPNDMETRRQFSFDHINGTTQISDLMLEVKPPSDAARFMVGLIVKCTTCDSPNDITKFTISISGRR